MCEIYNTISRSRDFEQFMHVKITTVYEAVFFIIYILL